MKAERRESGGKGETGRGRTGVDRTAEGRKGRGRGVPGRRGRGVRGQRGRSARVGRGPAGRAPCPPADQAGSTFRAVRKAMVRSPGPTLARAPFRVSRRAPRVWPCARPCALARSVRKRFHGCCVGRPAALDTAGWGKPPPHSPQAVDRVREANRVSRTARRAVRLAGVDDGTCVRVGVRVNGGAGVGAGGPAARPNRSRVLRRSVAVRDLVRCGVDAAWMRRGAKGRKSG